MKFIVVILSAYIMVLTAMPCDDIHATNTISASLELCEQSHSQSNDVDLCSPFCFCHCCQTLSQPATHTTSQIMRVGLNLTLPSFVQNEMGSTISFWRPPKF